MRVTSTTLLVSPRTEGLDLVSLDEPEDEILEQPEQHLPMHRGQRTTDDGGGKVLVRWERQLQALQHEETVGQHDERQVPMQAIPASPLEIVQTTFLFGIFVKLLNHPPRVSQGDQTLQRGVRGQRTEPVLRLAGCCFSRRFLLGRGVLWHWLGGRRVLILG